MPAISLGASFVMLEGQGRSACRSSMAHVAAVVRARGQQEEALLALKETAAAAAKGASVGEERGWPTCHGWQ
jgi:hypothetical protein